MKKISFIPFLLLILSIFISSCSDKLTYAQRLKNERELIANYIQRNNIKILKEFPKDSVSFKENEYVKLPGTDIYFRLEKQGTGDNVEKNNQITPLYYEYTLDENPDTTDYKNRKIHAYPNDFHYLKMEESCAAFHEAVRYMKKNGAEAKLIVPSKWGFVGTEINLEKLTPYGYDLEIRFKSDHIPTSEE